MPSGQEGIMPGLTVSGSPRATAIVRQSFTAMTPAERARVAAMYGAIAGRIEEKWTAGLLPGKPGGMAREPPAAEGGEPLVIHSAYNNPGGA
jgi:hypothetical protein